MQLPGGMARPMIAVVTEGPNGRRLLDGLLDSGCDRTICPRREARSIGLRLPRKADGTIKTAGGVAIEYRLADVVWELRASGTVVRWRASTTFADDPLNLIHLGMRGFLEYFHCTFLGPEKKVWLEPQDLLPKAT